MSKKDNTEQAILQAAETEFLDKGFALAKTTEIAKQAGARHVALLLSDKRKTVRAGFSRESGFDGPFLSGYLGRRKAVSETNGRLDRGSLRFYSRKPEVAVFSSERDSSE